MYPHNLFFRGMNYPFILINQSYKIIPSFQASFRRSTRSSLRNFKSALSIRKTVRSNHSNSYSLKTVEEGGSATHILDIPEEIFRMIFAFLEDAEVYFKLRAVCRQIKEYAEKYVEQGK